MFLIVSPWWLIFQYHIISQNIYIKMLEDVTTISSLNFTIIYQTTWLLTTHNLISFVSMCCMYTILKNWNQTISNIQFYKHELSLGWQKNKWNNLTQSSNELCCCWFNKIFQRNSRLTFLHHILWSRFSQGAYQHKSHCAGNLGKNEGRTFCIANKARQNKRGKSQYQANIIAIWKQIFLLEPF